MPQILLKCKSKPGPTSRLSKVQYLKQGLYEQAEQLFLESLTHIDLHVEQIALNGLGELYLVLGRLSEAHQYYEHALSVSKGRPYYVAQATLGLLWVDVISLTFQNVLENKWQIEELSMEHAYHDHLANLRLTQGHVSCEGHIPEWGSGNEAALSHYQQALICALRFNRFLLDEVLWGGGVATPLRPIIPHCLERGEEGRRMLIALRDWWKSGANDIGAPRPDTISPIPEGIPLLEAERIAREREPGDGSPQVGVVERIERALKETEVG